MFRYLLMASYFPVVVLGQSSTVINHKASTGKQKTIATAHVTFVIHVPEKLEMTIRNENRETVVKFTSNISGDTITRQNNSLIVATP